MFLSDDDMVECPYNKTHRMLRKRLQSHLLKCRLSYPDVELRKCPFNITHLIPEPEFTHHATNCPDRKLITQYKYDAPEQKEDEGPKHAPIECDENWDDTDVNDYNPRLYLDNANVIRKPDGANRSERKLFIKKERKRLGDGDDSSDEESKCDVSFPGSKRQLDSDYDVEQGGSEYDNRRSRNEKWTRGKRSSRSKSPPTSSYSIRNDSPINNSKRDRSRSPAGFKRTQKDHSPPRGGSIDYSRHRSPPPHLNSAHAFYHMVGGRNISNNQYNSGRDPYYSSTSQVYDNSNTETNITMPPTPPPPMISYPIPRSYFSAKPPSSGK